jgi:hypothetical protein
MSYGRMVEVEVCHAHFIQMKECLIIQSGSDVLLEVENKAMLRKFSRVGSVILLCCVE